MVQLEQQAAGFRERGMEVAALTYDRPELLRQFAGRVGIRYPLLGDKDSAVIRAFGILNDEIPPDHEFHGVPYPGTYVIDEKGVVRAKYFEENYRERYTPATVLTHYFGSEGRTGGSAETQHLKLTWEASQSELRVGNRVALVLRVELKPGMHVYAPGVEGYIPVEWKMEESTGWTSHEVKYPPSRALRLEAIRETVPVYAGAFRLERDITVAVGSGVQAVMTPSERIAVKGSFRYQACDDKICYRPGTVPLEWSLQLTPHDRTRAPEDLRR